MRDIATYEEMPNIASLIDKNQLDMPLTSFGLQLTQESVEKILQRVKSSKKNKPNKVTEPLPPRQSFYKEMSLS